MEPNFGIKIKGINRVWIENPTFILPRIHEDPEKKSSD